MLAGGLLKVVAALCLYVLIEHGPNIFLAWGFLLSTTFALQLLFLPILIRAKAVGYYQKHANGFVDTTVALSEDGVSLEIERSQKAYGWDEVAFVIVTPNGLVFCEKGSRLLFCLPSRLFSEHVTCEEVQLFLESMGVALRRVS